MSLKQHEGSKYWWDDFYVGEGKNRRRIRKSTGLTDEHGPLQVSEMLNFYQQCVVEENIDVTGLNRRYNLLRTLAVWIKRNTRIRFASESTP